MRSEKIIKLSKILLWIYMILTFVNILLPDEFVIGITKLDYRLDPFQMIIRWFNFVAFLALPIAVYFDKSIFKKISIYFCLPVIIIFMFMFKDVLPGYMSELGTGIVDIRYLPDFISSFMHNGLFRGILFFLIAFLEIAIIILLLLRDYKVLRFNKKEILNFCLILIALIVSIVPIYALEGIFDNQSNIKFKIFSFAHICWILILVGEIVGLYFLFRKKSYEDKFILLLILSLALLVQYNQLFSSLGELTCKRMPLQLCNLASYLILFSLILKNRKIFIFNLLINVAGAIIAIIILDADNSGLISKGNVHYIVEHNNVVVIPILCLLLRVFEPVKKGEYKIFIKWYCIYFAIILVLGTLFNYLYASTGSDYFRCNYIFMFDANKAIKLVSFVKPIVAVKYNIGGATFYPLLQFLIFIFMGGMGMLSYVIFRKTIKEKIA